MAFVEFYDELAVEPLAFVGKGEAEVIIGIDLVLACGRYLQTAKDITFLETKYVTTYLETPCE